MPAFALNADFLRPSSEAVEPDAGLDLWRVSTSAARSRVERYHDTLARGDDDAVTAELPALLSD